MFDYGLGGTERKKEGANEAFAEIQMNRTIFIQQLTAEESYGADIVQGLDTVEAAFNHYKPNVDIEFETEDGSAAKESVSFSGLGDFGAKGITNKSAFLQEQSVKQEQFQKFGKNLKSSKPLQAVMANPEMKSAYLSALQAMIKELEEAGA